MSVGGRQKGMLVWKMTDGLEFEGTHQSIACSTEIVSSIRIVLSYYEMVSLGGRERKE